MFGENQLIRVLLKTKLNNKYHENNNTFFVIQMIAAYLAFNAVIRQRVFLLTTLNRPASVESGPGLSGPEQESVSHTHTHTHTL